MKKKAIVVAAHPDDEVLGCGGTIAKLSSGGVEVYTIILGEGVTSRYEKRIDGIRDKSLIELKSHIRKTAGLLGVKKTFIFDFPDNRFDTVSMLDIIKVIEKVKNEIKPEIIYTHFYGDLNIDHQITSQAVLTSCRPVRQETVKEIYAFEVPSSTDWNYKTTFSPNVYIDISKTINKKIRAIKVYKSEIRPWPHPRSVKAIKLLAEKRGCDVGLNFAESFELVRCLK